MASQQKKNASIKIDAEQNEQHYMMQKILGDIIWLFIHYNVSENIVWHAVGFGHSFLFSSLFDFVFLIRFVLGKNVFNALSMKLEYLITTE